MMRVSQLSVVLLLAITLQSTHQTPNEPPKRYKLDEEDISSATERSPKRSWRESILNLFVKMTKGDDYLLTRWNKFTNKHVRIELTQTTAGKDVNHYIVDGDVKLKKVFARLQNFLTVSDLGKGKRTQFSVPIGGEYCTFRFYKGMSGDQIMVETLNGGKWKAKKYTDIMKPLYDMDSKTVATELLQALDSDISKQPKFAINGDSLREFLILTNVAEAATPVKETYVEIWKKILEDRINVDDDNKIIQELQDKLKDTKPKSGRTPQIDKFIRKKLKQIKAGELTFKTYFKDFPVFKQGGASLGREMTIGSEGSESVSESTNSLLDSQGSDVFNENRATSIGTDTVKNANIHNQQEIVTKLEANEDGQKDLIKQLIDENVGEHAQDYCRRRRKKRSVCKSDTYEHNIRIKESSLEFEGDKLTFIVVDSADSAVQRRVEIAIRPEQLIRENFMEEIATRNAQDPSPTRKGKSMARVNRALGLFGIFSGITAAKGEIQRGNDLRGAMFLSQSIYMAGGIVGINNFISKSMKKIAGKAMTSLSVKLGMQTTVQKMTSKIAKSMLGRIASNIPIVGLGFDIYFIQEDIKDLINTDFSDPDELIFVPLKIINLGLDVASTTLSLLGPEMEPFAMAVSIFRMVFSEFYINIVSELQKVNWHSPWAPLHAVGAFVLGYYKALANIFTGGLFSSMDNLGQEESQNKKLIQKLNNPENYYSIESGEDNNAINFNTGDFSVFGGGIKFFLYDNGTVYLSIQGVPQQGGSTKTIYRTFQLETDIHDIILGIGQSRQFTYTKKTAKLFWFIPVKSYNIICGEKFNRKSYHGTYVANSFNNRFFAVQSLPGRKRRKRSVLPYEEGRIRSHGRELAIQNKNVYEAAHLYYRDIQKEGTLLSQNDSHQLEHQNEQPNIQKDELNLVKPIEHQKYQHVTSRRQKRECANNYGKIDSKANLETYFYNIDGGAGNDTFFLGPQTSLVKGNTGADLYIVPSGGGTVYINNFDHDVQTDIVYLNVSFENIECERNLNNLSLISDTSHYIVIVNYYLSEKFQHIIFRSADGVIFYPNSTKAGKVVCVASAVEKSSLAQGVLIDLRIDIFKNVLSVIGTNFTDYIYGNDEDNVLDGGEGSDYIEGGGGMDTYIIHTETSREVTINNSHSENEPDQLIIEAPFNTLNADKEENDLIILVDRLPRRRKVGLFDDWWHFYRLFYEFYRSIIPEFFCKIRIQNWFENEENRHITLISGDHVLFKIEMRDGAPYLIPVLIDFSTYGNESGIYMDMERKIARGFNYSTFDLSKITTVVDSPMDDEIYGNSLSNFISCSGGIDALSGGQGMDRYVVKEECNLVRIDNFDQDNATDILFLSRLKEDLSLEDDNDTLVIKQNCQRLVEFINWFKDARYQHLVLQLTRGDVLKLPETKYQLSSIFSYRPLQVELNEDPLCGKDGLYVLDLQRYFKYKYVQRVHFTSAHCTYRVIGNDLDNFFLIGPGTPWTTQYLEGGDGQDVYAVNQGDGLVEINNFAKDNDTDHVKIDLLYEDLILETCGRKENDHLIIRSKEASDLLHVTLLHFCKGPDYQHILIHTTDGVTLSNENRSSNISFIRVQQIDKSASTFAQIIDLDLDEKMSTTTNLYGAKEEENELFGNENNNKLIGGNDDDGIYGDDGNDWIDGGYGEDYLVGGAGLDVIFGGGGNDVIYGQEDDDVIFPGNGEDIVDGGLGSDTLVFKGDVFKMEGVYVNLDLGFGLNADADGDLYFSMENALGSEFDDVLIGNNGSNLLYGYSGNDMLLPGHGDDKLSGGEGEDYYVLSGSIGVKNIDNYSGKQMIDYLIVNDSVEMDMCSYRYNGDLHVAFLTNESDSKTFLLSNDNHLHVTIEDWFFGIAYKHIIFQLGDQMLQETDEYFSNTVDVSELNNALENFTSLSLSTGYSSVYISWSADVIENITNLCNCSIYVAYRSFDDIDLQTQNNRVVWTSRGFYYIENVSSGLNGISINYDQGTYEVRIMLGKCDRVVSMSPSVYYRRPVDLAFLIIGMVLGLITVLIAVLSAVLVLKRRKTGSYTVGHPSVELTDINTTRTA